MSDPVDDAPLNEADEDEIIAKFVNNTGEGDPLDFKDLGETEKAPDAIDYEDISDEDLADDDDEFGSLEQTTVDKPLAISPSLGNVADEIPGADEVEPDIVLDDLFEGDADFFDNDDTAQHEQNLDPAAHGSGYREDDGQAVALLSGLEPSFTNLPDPVRSIENLPEDSTPITDAERLQLELFSLSRAGLQKRQDHLAPAENATDLLHRLWPRFRRSTVPHFMDLIAPKKARFMGKQPPKRLRTTRPTKLIIEIASDQNKGFRINSGGNNLARDDLSEQGVQIISFKNDEHESENNRAIDSQSDEEDMEASGYSWEDIQLMCQDWRSSAPPSDPRKRSSVDLSHQHSHKRRKIESYPSIERSYKSRNFTAPEYATAEIGKQVILDLNDPYLYVIADSAVSHQAPEKRLSSGGLVDRKQPLRRYNISNDLAYDLLKENHQSKSRNSLGNLTLQHSLPALRLQWPFYKTKLSKREARAFHRPTAQFGRKDVVIFQKPKHRKRKHVKGKDTATIFAKSEDLSLGDNGTSLLLEHSEEHPMMMSNFGMGTRILNYYRRRDLNDNTRVKGAIGESMSLLPEDTSPLTSFGPINPGECVPVVYNLMFKAPLFEHTLKSSDFLVVRNSTGVEGATWYLRNVDYIRVVGQQFPSVEVPGPNSRRVNGLSKNRLRMISYRFLRNDKEPKLTTGDITAHFPETNDGSNRLKLKEFLVHNKESRGWEMRPGEHVPDANTIRALIAPEDVCLYESMQVGQQHLIDEGFVKDIVYSEEEQNPQPDRNDDRTLTELLAPWETSKNFLTAAMNKAMLELHGDGDPSGHGEAFSFLKTSMKGGFRPVGESVEEKIDARKQQEIGGHRYNVQKQQKVYDDSVRRIWEAQRRVLSSQVENSDVEADPDYEGQGLDDGPQATVDMMPGNTARSFIDDSASQFSKLSNLSGHSQSNRILRITRRVEDKFGNVEEQVETVRDPKVIRQYVKKRQQKAIDNIDVTDLMNSDREPHNDLERQALALELARLERNQVRRLAREKQKAGTTGASPEPSASQEGKSAKTTQRKCANCGRAGHIKTNKRLCPLLNGEISQADGFGEASF